MLAKEKSVKKFCHIGPISHLKFMWLKIFSLEDKILSNLIIIFYSIY